MSGSVEVNAAAQPVEMINDTACLRILATTDIHMQLVGHDYITDQQTANKGLAGIATLIEQARIEAHDENSGCILLDNGDLLQGSPIGDLLATRQVDASHPVAASINAMRYDAIGVGNHDLDFGMEYLIDFATYLKMPVVSTNLIINGQSPLQKAAIVNCPMPAKLHGQTGSLRIGILSALPTKTVIWNRTILRGQATIDPVTPSLERAAVDLRSQGADLVVVLAHMGIGHGGSDEEDSALSLAHIPGIDAIISGHTHQRFPGLDHVGREGVDAHTGTLGQRPAIMPGFAGSDLAVLDLVLSRSDQEDWRVMSHISKLRRNGADVSADETVATLCAPAHLATRAHLAETVGHTDQPLHNYFSLAMPTPVATLTARAKARVVREALANTADAQVPVLAAVAAHTAGGRNGPDHYLSIPKGQVLRRHIAGLEPYANQIWGLRITGADLRGMLEKSATIFTLLRSDLPDQLLIDSEIPSFNFDTVFGISYRIDPTKPPGDRIRSLHHANQPIQPGDRFLLATNQFRASGGGGFSSAPCDSVALRSSVNLETALITTLAHPNEHIWPVQQPWSFQCDDPVQAVLLTSPAALEYLQDAAHLSPQFCGTTADGFVRLRLTL